MFNLLSDEDILIGTVFTIFIIIIIIIILKKPNDKIEYIDYVLDSNGQKLFGIYQSNNFYIVKNFNTKIDAYFKTYQEVEIFIKNWNNWTTKKSN